MSSTSFPSPHSSLPLPGSAVAPLPSLPIIHSDQLRERIFTHRGQPTSNKYSFQAPESDPSNDNEQLTHIGDQVVGLAITDLIQALYPYLRVGPASKVRDKVKHRSVLAKICVLYGLHEQLNLPGNQARNIRASPNVQVDVFKAYVGGVYKDQGPEVVLKWLLSLFESHVEAAYQNVRDAYHPSPGTAVVLQPGARTARGRSPTSSTSSSEGTGFTPPSQLVGDQIGQHRRIPVQADGPQQGSWHWPASDGIDARLAVGPDGAYQPTGSHRRRRDSGRDGDMTEGARKRLRTEEADWA
ncbi:ribonuclease III domain-containing protein [Russula dissimulans]|nr:ribonuclease III domain-containing protein [Russula dissimulans]